MTTNEETKIPAAEAAPEQAGRQGRKGRSKGAVEAGAIQPEKARDDKTAFKPRKSAKVPGLETPAGDAGITEAKAPKGKLCALIELLRREGGATLDDMVAATGWQTHSVRGAISGHIKKKLGLEVTSKKVEGVRRYQIAEKI